MPGNVHRHVAADQILQLRYVEDGLVVDRGRSPAVQCDGGRCPAVVDIEGAQAVQGVRAVAVADDQLPARQPAGVQRMKDVVGKADVAQRLTVGRVLDDQRALNERHQNAVVDRN